MINKNRPQRGRINRDFKVYFQ